MVYISKKACTAFKNVGGNAWFSFMKGFNIPSDSCPLKAVKYENIKNSYIGTYLGININHNLCKLFDELKWTMVELVLKLKMFNILLSRYSLGFIT